MANPYDDFLSGLKNTVGLTTGLIDETLKRRLGDPYKILNNKNMTPETIEEVLKDIKDIRKNGLFFLDTLSNPNNPSSRVNLSDFDQGDYDLAKVKINIHGFQEIELYEQQAQALRNIQKYGNKDILDEMHARQLINESESLKNEIINNQSGQSKNIKDRKPKLKNADKSYRPEVTMNGNNVEVDSIYNHSVPRKVNNVNRSTDLPEFNVNNAEELLNDVEDFFNNNIEGNSVNNTSTPNYTYNRNLEQGDTINLNTGDIEKADGTIVKEDGTVVPPPETNPLQNELNEEIRQADQQRQQTSQPEVQQQPQRYSPDLTPEEQAAVDRANAQWRADSEARYADMDKQIENMYKADDIVFGTPEQILDPNYVSAFDPLEETVESTMDAAKETINQTSKSTPRGRTGRQTGRYAKQRNAARQSTKNRGRSGNAKGKTGSTKSIDQLHQEANQRKWANEQYAKNQAEQLNKYKQTYEDILDDWKKTSGNFSGNLDNRNLKMPNRLINNGSNSHQMYTEAGDYYKYIEDANTDYYRERYTDGSYTMDEQVFKYTEGEGVDGKTVLKNEGELIDNANEYAQQLDDTLKNAKSTMSPEDFEVFRNGYTPEATIRHNGNTPELNQRRVLRNSHLIESPAKFGAMDTIMSGVNILGAVGDYKAARRKGHGVISSAVRAGTQFAVYEALGAWALPVSLLQHAPGAVIKGADMLYKENRRMNSAANFQVFGDAQFMDTQQLATMRQSGMEMAKMSQYNLQQTLMGNEATYLHR